MYVVQYCHYQSARECIPSQNQDPRSKICTEVLWKILDLGTSCPIPRSKIQDLHRSLVENLGFGNILPKTKIQDPRFAQKSCGKSWIWEHPAQYQDPRSKICTEVLWKILDLGTSCPIPRSKILARSLVGILDVGSWYFQDFSQESCGNLGSWILVFPRF